MNPIFALILLIIGGGLYAVSEESVANAYNEVNKMFAPAPIPKDPIYMEIKKEDERRLKERNDRVAFCESKLKLVLNDEGMYNLGLKEYCQDPTAFNEKTGEPVYYFSIYKEMKAMMGKKAPTPLAPLSNVVKGASNTLGK
jgi:hypothetical protein